MIHRTKISRLVLAACLPLLPFLCSGALRPVRANGLASAAEQPSNTQVRRPAVQTPAESQSAPAYGIYPAIVISRADANMRVQVKVPTLNINGEWALPCVPVGSTAAPPIQSRVWVMFEQGNTHYPVWMGVFPGN